ncbi:MAG: galactose mutarotase [Fusobacteriaceae bacterium]|jgi:aldose 1-epimerase|nr:galactose mutarotase [Fusobacteriaceae bacterium]
MKVYIDKFGITKSNEEVIKYTLINENLQVEILNYGGIIRKILAPNRYGKMENVVIGMNTITDYEERSASFGAIIGRVAGRISKGEFVLNDKIYQLSINSNGVNSIHGGLKGFGKKVWKSKEIIGDDYVGVELSLFSPDLDEGYPGNVNITVMYILIKNQLSIEYSGTSDTPTFLNLTNHTYFNLSGDLKKTILKHQLKLNASKFNTVDENTLPVEIKNVVGTPFDFRSFKRIEKAINSDDDQIKITNGGIDHGFIIDKKIDKKIGELKDSETGRKLEVFDDQNIVVVYTGNNLMKVGKILDGKVCKKHHGICLETQNYTDIFRFAKDKIKIIDENNPYKQKTIFKFSVENK